MSGPAVQRSAGNVAKSGRCRERAWSRSRNCGDPVKTRTTSSASRRTTHEGGHVGQGGNGPSEARIAATSPVRGAREGETARRTTKLTFDRGPGGSGGYSSQLSGLTSALAVDHPAYSII